MFIDPLQMYADILFQGKDKFRFYTSEMDLTDKLLIMSYK